MKSASQFLRRRRGQEDEAGNLFKNDAFENKNRKTSMKTRSIWVLGVLTIYVAVHVILTGNSKYQSEIVFHKSAETVIVENIIEEGTKYSPLEGFYITLWLHQVHSWMKGESDEATKLKVESFIKDAKSAGFKEVMIDIPWSWTEREAQGDIRLDTFAKTLSISAACELGLSLHVVLNMRELPPWFEQIAKEDKSIFEVASNGETCQQNTPEPATPSLAHPEVWKLIKSFVETTTEMLVDRYGECIASVSPTTNNEFETRYSQTNNKMRDYSAPNIELYKRWQVEKGFSSSIEESLDAPHYPCHPGCEARIEENDHKWFGYREEFLAGKYIELCQIVKTAKGNTSSHHPDCLLHIGEIYTTTDNLNSNLFFKLAQSEFVDHLVMDSNMALFGAPVNPSIVGILVSAAQSYGKSVHYEAATERILLCDESGALQSGNAELNSEKGVALLFRHGIQNSLDAGVHSLGVTNLCSPGVLKNLLASLDQRYVNNTNVFSLQRAESFKPTALIFVPYRAFYAYSFVISGARCGIEHTPCWHDSFEEIPRFGFGLPNRKSGMCNVDVVQQFLIKTWDDLRTRHSQIAVISDLEKLNDNLLQSAKERVLLRFPCVMTNSTWNFFEGKKSFDLFFEKTQNYPFLEVSYSAPHDECG